MGKALNHSCSGEILPLNLKFEIGQIHSKVFSRNSIVQWEMNSSSIQNTD